MSMQQSEAHRDRIGDVLADEVPPPTRGAIHRTIIRGRADRLRSAAAIKRRAEVAEAAALGVAIITKVNFSNIWTEAEDAVVRALYPHYAEMNIKLPHRSRKALQTRASDLELVTKRKLWTSKELDTLKRLWSTATVAELNAALPRWSGRGIESKAHHLGLPNRGRPPLRLTGNTLCDEIRDRCRVLGYSMDYLDRIARSGTYFSAHGWKGAHGHSTAPMIRAVNALGGVLRVEWPD